MTDFNERLARGALNAAAVRMQDAWAEERLSTADYDRLAEQHAAAFRQFHAGAHLAAARAARRIYSAAATLIAAHTETAG